MKRLFSIISLLIILVLVIGVVGCSQEKIPTTQPTSQVREPVKVTSPEPADEPTKKTIVKETANTAVSSVKEFNVVATQWKFDPGTIKVKQGDKVKLMIKSEDVPHGFRLADFDISERLNPGETVNVEFTADKKGTFNFFCSVPCGAGHGTMKGQLVVE
ncbi:cupredoxin domain-containing protein [Candidatus Woesearchaeota archaeon]|nr:cupredoxin domain-containing protein [Candidatus Woesearchaeota archaeon]